VDGHIVVADEGARKVFSFSPDGLKRPDYDANLPFQVGFDRDGNLYYLDRKFLKDRDIDPHEVKGDFPTVVMRPTAGGRIVLHEFEDGDWDQTAMAVRPDGSVVIAQVWVADIENERGRLVSIPAGGGAPEDLLALDQPLALHIDGEGALWIGERSLEQGVGGRLLRLAPGTAEPDVILPQPGEANPLVSPGAIAEADDGRLIVADRLSDVYEGATRTGGLFSLQKDGTDLRVLLDHPDYPPPNAVGVIHVPPFACASYRDCPAPACLEEEKVCPPKEDCADDALTCAPEAECADDALLCPAGRCTDAHLCEVPVACKLKAIDYGPDAPAPPPPEDEGCTACAAGGAPGRAAPSWWGALLRR
jgi:hypothetical protein